MKAHSLSKNGLSMSQAQSISNLCNQKVREINLKLNNISVTEKFIIINNEKQPLQKASGMLPNIKDVLIEKGMLSSLQAFLMENIKAKELLLKEQEHILNNFDPEDLSMPVQKDYTLPDLTLEKDVDEQYGFEQLSSKEWNDYLYNEAMASHIGQFIHKDCKLDKLRTEVSKTDVIEWQNFTGHEKQPVFINYVSTPEELSLIHEELTQLHRFYEQKVNYYKAKVKNIVNEKNTEISIKNKELTQEWRNKTKEMKENYNTAFNTWNAEYNSRFEDLKKQVLEEKNRIAKLRIQIPIELKPLLDKLLPETEH